MIKFENASKSYAGVAAISNLNLAIEQGELVVFLGPSGSGKSSALKMVNRMVAHDGGHILFNGQDIARFNVQDVRRRGALRSAAARSAAAERGAERVLLQQVVQ